MRKRFVPLYFSASLACMIPFPGRFAYGLILVAEVFMLVFAATLLRDAIRKLEFVRIGNLLFMSFIVSLTMLFRQILTALLPLAALTLGFALYVPAVSAFVAGFVPSDETTGVKSILKRNMSAAALFSCFALAFFLLRDIVGFGTITYIGPRGIAEKVLFDSGRIASVSFFATIPGALIALALILAVSVFIAAKSVAAEKAETNHD